MSDDMKQDRRGFLLSLGRCLAAGGLAFGVGALAARPGETCVNQGTCAGCPVLEGCRLPRALSARKDMADQEKLRDCERRDL